jgi:hypothetical protein
MLAIKKEANKSRYLGAAIDLISKAMLMTLWR